MQDVNELIAAALTGLSCPATRTPAQGADEYVTWSVIEIQPTAYASDRPRRLVYTVQIDIYSRRHYALLLCQVLAHMGMAGFALRDVAAEDYESDTRYHHVPITYMWAADIEEEIR